LISKNGKINRTDNYRWLILLLCYLSVMLFAFAFQSIPPLVDLIRRDLGFSFTEIGLLMSFFALPGIFLTIPAGMSSDRYGILPVAMASIITVTVGTIVVILSNGFILFAIGRAISGLGAIVLTILAAQLLTKWFIEKDLGLAMGIYSTAFPLGTIAAFNIFGLIGENFGWKLPIYFVLFFSLFILIFFMIIFKEPPSLGAKEKDNDSIKSFKNIFTTNRSILYVGITWLTFNAAFISLLTFGPDFLVSRGFDPVSADSISSSLMWGAVILSPLIGRFIDKSQAKELMIISGNLLLIIIFLLIPSSGISLIPLFVVLGFAAALVPVNVYSLPADIIESRSLGLGFGIITTCLNIGIVLGPLLIGFSRDRSGSFTFSFSLMAIFSLLSAASTYIVLRRRKNV